MINLRVKDTKQILEEEIKKELARGEICKKMVDRDFYCVFED